MTFNEYKGLDLVATGNEMLEMWRREDAFRASMRLREGAPKFIFFEGPPSANGKPGIHHVMARRPVSRWPAGPAGIPTDCPLNWV